MRSSVLAAALLAAAPGAWRPADPAHRWSFPRDHFLHPEYRNEWWYFTGIVRDRADPGRRLGFQATFFRVGLLPRAPALDSAWAASDAVMVHLAVTDVAAGTHRFGEALWRAVPLLGGFPPAPGPAIAWARAPAGTDGLWTLRLEEGAFRISARDDARGIGVDLALRPASPPILQGEHGLSRKSAGGAAASLYASIPRLATEGTITLDGRRLDVAGESWMDEERGSSQLAPDQAGWDWFGLRLADGRDLMLYALRGRDGLISWTSGTVVERGRVRLLAHGSWSARALGTWRSAASGATYPSGWELAVPAAGVHVTVVPEVRDAENRSSLVPGLAYWEGPVRITAEDGRSAGEGYVELTGYAGALRLPL